MSCAVAVAVAPRELWASSGIDLQSIERVDADDASQLEAAICTGEERLWMGQQTDRVGNLMRTWTAKEAILKANGVGLLEIPLILSKCTSDKMKLHKTWHSAMFNTTNEGSLSFISIHADLAANIGANVICYCSINDPLASMINAVPSESTCTLLPHEYLLLEEHLHALKIPPPMQPPKHNTMAYRCKQQAGSF